METGNRVYYFFLTINAYTTHQHHSESTMIDWTIDKRDLTTDNIRHNGQKLYKAINDLQYEQSLLSNFQDMRKCLHK